MAKPKQPPRPRKKRQQLTAAELIQELQKVPGESKMWCGCGTAIKEVEHDKETGDTLVMGD